MLREWLRYVCLASLVGTLQAGDLAAPTVARILRVISASGGADGRIACADGEVAAELGRLGVVVDPKSRIVWTVSEREVIQNATPGRLVICGQLGFLGKGAALAVTAEGGRPTFYLNLANMTSSGLTLPDSVVKISKVVK